jgi:Alginate lyase
MTYRYLTHAICALGLAIGAAAQAGPVSIKPNEVERLRALVAKDPEAAALFAKLRKTADEALDDQPNPVAVIVSAGTLASDPAKIKTAESLRDMAKIEALAWSAVVTGDQRYWSKARGFVLAWAVTNKPDGNPINDTVLEPLIEAYDITRDSFSPQDQMKIDAWLVMLVERLQKQDSKQPQKNWESHRVKLIGLAAMTLRDRRLEIAAKQAYMEQLKNNFDASGESVDFRERDALHYHIYAVRPLLTFACAERRSGENIYAYTAPNGASLERAVEFVLPFAQGEKKHTEFVNSTAAFDKTRAKAGEAEYQPHAFEPRSAVSLFAEAGCLNPAYNKIAAMVVGSKAKYVNWRMVLNTLNDQAAPR